MTKKEIASLIFLLLTIVTLIICFQLEKGGLRDICTLLGMFFLYFSLDPSCSVFKKKKWGKNIKNPVVERTPLTSEEPLEVVDTNNKDIYLVIKESLSDTFFCCHYIDGGVCENEIYAISPDKTYYRLDIDELPEYYLNLCDVSEEKTNGDIDYLCSISSADFEHVKNCYLDSKIEANESAMRESEDTSNRIARFVVKWMVFFAIIFLFTGLCVFIESYLPYQDGNMYMMIFVIMTIVCISALCYSLTDRAWIARRGKWIGEDFQVQKIKETKDVTYYLAGSELSPTFFLYYQKEKLFFYGHRIDLPITKDVQLIPVQMMEMEKWVRDKDYILDYNISDKCILGRYTYHFCMNREQATKPHLLEIREWLKTQEPNNESSYLLFTLSNGDYYVEYGQRMIQRIIYKDNEGNKEKVRFAENDKNPYDGVSKNVKRFLIDFFDYHALNSSSYHILTQEQFLEIWE